MLRQLSPMWLIAGWFTSVAIVVAWSVGVDARLSTSLLLLVFGVSPLFVLMFMRAGTPSPSVSGMLHAVNAVDAPLKVRR